MSHLSLSVLVAFGPQGTPRARLIRETIREWFLFVRSLSPGSVNALRCAWAKCATFLKGMYRLRASSITNHIRSLMSNVIVLLLKAQWDPTAFNVWKATDGSLWIMNDSNTSPEAVTTALIHAYLHLEYSRASCHYNGGGFQDGLQDRFPGPGLLVVEGKDN